MQTFLPYPDFDKSMQCLDPARLGNQIWREAIILIRGGWADHPAAKMWRGYTGALAAYGLAGIKELEKRNQKKYYDVKGEFRWYASQHPLVLPWWWGDERLHSSHRSNLLRKRFEWYNKFGWKEPVTLPYFWPV